MRALPSLLIACVVGMTVPPSLAQLISPEVDAEGRVTVRLPAPAASSVVVHGFAEAPLPLKKTDSEGGVWEVTTPPLAPEIYDYTFEVDGAMVIDPHNRRVKKWRSLASMVEVVGDGRALHTWQSVPHGAVTQHRYSSSATGGERNVMVYTPPGYPTHPERSYPVVYLFHGFGDDETAWQENGRAHVILDNLLAQERCVPMIVVMPYGHPVPIPEDVEFDEYAPRNTRVLERDLFDDLMPFIGERYRVTRDRRERAITGLSMGGGHSLTIGLRHLETFAWIGGFSSAAPTEAFENAFPRLLENLSVTNDRLARLWVGCGNQDFLLERNRAFVAQLESAGVEHLYEETEGAHTWAVWRKYWADFAEACFK